MPYDLDYLFFVYLDIRLSAVNLGLVSEKHSVTLARGDTLAGSEILARMTF